MIRSQSVTDIRSNYLSEKKPAKLFLNNFLEKQQEIEKDIMIERNMFEGNLLSNGSSSKQGRLILFLRGRKNEF
jgi:hypothetical protein